MLACVLLFLIAATVLSAWGCDPRFMTFSMYIICWLLLLALLILALLNRLSPKKFLLGACGVALLFFIGFTHWPLKLAFLLVKPGLMSMSTGETIDVHRRALFFKVKKIEQREDGTIYWIHQSSDGEVAFVQGDALSERLNLWSRVKLQEGWSYVVLD